MTGPKHNNPPDPIDEALAPFADAIAESNNWLDGEKVTTEDQMKAVDDILKQVRSAGTAVNRAEKSETAPLYDTYKAEKARWKPTIDDLKVRKDGLAALINDFKRELAAKKEAEKRAAFQEAERLRIEAEEKARKADASNIEEQREAMEAKQAAMDAKKAATTANKDTIKGLRTVHKHVIEDHRAALHWIASNDRDEMTRFIEQYVARHYKDKTIDGVKSWTEKEAY